jgi:hypothetical protein
VRRRLSWLIALPLMAGGSVAARWFTQICIPPAGSETGNEAGEHVQRVASVGNWPLVFGLLAALICVALLTQTVAVARHRPLRCVPASAFFRLPSLAFLGQEISELATRAVAARRRRPLRVCLCRR